MLHRRSEKALPRLSSTRIYAADVQFTIQQIAEITRGSCQVESGTRSIDGATQDSRSIETGQLFVPLVAERDGHDFIEAAMASGAGGYLTHGPTPVAGGVVVENTMDALRDLARAARQRIEGPVIGITGSVGKTSAKDLLAGAMRTTMATHASVKSFNNEIGVPLTLINTPEGSEAAIIEMGSRGIGHVAELCDVASPTIGMVTTVAAAHTGEFGSIENIAIAKGELIEAVPASGLAVLNHDNPLVTAMASRTDASILTFGKTPGAAIHIRSVELDNELRATFVLDTEWGTVTARPSTRGAHMATNVAAAAGTALWLGVGIADVEAGLSQAQVSPWRMEVRHTPTGALIINDAYNANPTSMAGALDSLDRLPQTRKIAVLGYMGELGESEADDHRNIAETARATGAQLITVGTELYGQASTSDVIAAIGPVDADTAVLIKGSRSAGLEIVAAELLAETPPAQ